MSTPCRSCATPVAPFLDLGRQPVSQVRFTPGRLGDEGAYPLVVARCPRCHLVQLVEQPPPAAMFAHDYPYQTATSQVMAEHFRLAAGQLCARFVPPGGRVVEIGCNDGSFLRHVAAAGIAHRGVEPAANVARQARRSGATVVEAFFGAALAQSLAADFGTAHLIFAANVLAHVPDIADVAQGAARLLERDGALVFEAAYLGDIVRQGSFDQFYDEHVFTWSALAVQAVFALAGLALFHVEPLAVHGGSMRFFLGHAGRRPASEAVAALLADERAQGLDGPAPYARLSRAAQAIRATLPPLVERLRATGALVAGYGATAKSTTLLNYCGLNGGHIAFISDNTPAKIGKLSPGSHIPIVSPDEFRARRPDYALLFAWNHRAEIEAKEQAWRAGGGQWILTVPELELA